MTKILSSEGEIIDTNKKINEKDKLQRRIKQYANRNSIRYNIIINA